MRKISRRAVLRGLGLSGIAIALPSLDAMSVGSAQPPDARRLVLFHFGNGAPMQDFTPASAGSGFALPPILEGLREGPARADFTRRVGVLTGLSNRPPGGCACAGFGSPHEPITLMSTTGSVPSVDAESRLRGAGGPSIDQLAADRLGHSPALVVAPRTRRMSFEGPISFQRAESPVLPETDPAALFATLFTAPGGDPSDVARAHALRGTVLDYVRDSIDGVRADVGAADQHRLDDHLDAIRDLERSIVAPGACEVPAPGAVDVRSDAELERHTEILLDLVVMALRCDLRRVVSFSIGPSGAGPTYPALRMPDGRTVEDAARVVAGSLPTAAGTNDHDISHFPHRADAASREIYRTVTRWKIARFASLLERLDASVEGDRTLLDRSAVVCFSEMGDGAAHDSTHLPVLVAGLLPARGHVVLPCATRGAVLSDGYRVVERPALCTATADTPLSNVWLTALHALGLDAPSFGNSTGTI
jgi:hypothetical protein